MNQRKLKPILVYVTKQEWFKAATCGLSKDKMEENKIQLDEEMNHIKEEAQEGDEVEDEYKEAESETYR